VIGVNAARFAIPGAKAWMPLAIRFDGHNSFTRPVVGRLKPDVLPQQAKAEVETFAGICLSVQARMNGCRRLFR